MLPKVVPVNIIGVLAANSTVDCTVITLVIAVVAKAIVVVKVNVLSNHTYPPLI